MANENLIREVDEELRSDRMRALWRRFGPYVIGAAVAVVLLVAINEGWSWWQQSNAERASDEFYAALELAEGTDSDGARAALDRIVASGSGGYPQLARFRQAALLAEQGQSAEALAAYDALATGERNQRLRELALLLGALLLVDDGDVAPVEQRVGSLDAPDNPMRNAARETLGLAKYRAGDLDGARASFEAALNDPLVGQDARTRLQIFLAQLVAEGATDPTAAAAEAAAAPGESMEAAPSVSEAPELDVAPPDDAAAPADAPAAPAPEEAAAPPPAATAN